MSYWDARDSTRDKNGQITTIDSDPARLFLMQSVIAQNIRCIVPPQPDFQMLSKFHQEKNMYILLVIFYWSVFIASQYKLIFSVHECHSV